MKHIGRRYEYYTNNGEMRQAKCIKIEFQTLLDKPIFIGVSPFGHEVRLTKEEIYRFI
ncbi:hypothetical protein [Lederbergia lenta]|uniref:hypothetical protein n=1 Tax=Lederbergia lenta TaxID=1467 RepID=UPI00203C534D|nr:hypothetical protein [Lederbergia lenta]MCM3109948.1 hypothetical protein [Lederbergia lenta]